MTSPTDTRMVSCGSILSAIAAALFLLLPVVVGTAAESGLYSESQLGLLASTYLAGFTLACLLSAVFEHRLAVRKTSITGFLFLLGGLLLNAALAGAFIGLLVGFCLAGLGAGSLFSVSFRLIVQARQIERAFGFKIFAEQVLGASLFFCLPLIAGDFVLLMLLTVLALAPGVLIIPWLPELADTQYVQGRRSPGRRPSKIFVAGLACVAVFMAALSGPWAFLESMVLEVGIQGARFSALGAAGILLGAVGALAVGFQGDRLGAALPLLAGGAVLAACLVGLNFRAETATMLIMLVIPLMWNYVLAFQMAVTSKLDKNHAHGSWLAPCVALGATLGPVSFGIFLQAAGTTQPVLLVSAFTLMLALSVTAVLNR